MSRVGDYLWVVFFVVLLVLSVVVAYFYGVQALFWL